MTEATDPADLPVDEVAQVLAIASGTVKSTLYDARKRVGAMLEREEQP